MSSRYTNKIYIADAYYHVFTRGNNKKWIFRDKEDYYYMLELLENYTSESNTYIRKNYFNKISILAYCILPNHYHFLIWQTDNGDRNLTNFMRSIHTAYAIYFNRKYKRSGGIFETVYKARLITSISDFVKVVKYIHCNAKNLTSKLEDYEFSSYKEYLIDNELLCTFLNRSFVLSAFNNNIGEFIRFHQGETSFKTIV